LTRKIIFTKANGKTKKKTVLVFNLKVAATFTLEIGKMGNKTPSGFIFSKMETSIKEEWKMGNFKEEFSLKQMEINTKENGLITKSTEKAFMKSRKPAHAMFIMDILKTMNLTNMEHTNIPLKIEHTRVFGRIIKNGQKKINPVKCF
jgi:hypothetical protein